MVEHSQRQLRRIGDVDVRNVAARLHQAQEGERAVEHANVAIARNQRHGVTIELRRSNDEALIANAGNVAVARKDNCPVLQSRPADRAAEQAGQSALQLVGGRGEKSDLDSWTTMPLACAVYRSRELCSSGL